MIYLKTKAWQEIFFWKTSWIVYAWKRNGSVNDYFIQIQGVLNQLTNIGVIVVKNELIIQIYPHFEIVGKSLLAVLCIEPQCLLSLN
jgi:hypothetical protein